MRIEKPKIWLPNAVQLAQPPTSDRAKRGLWPDSLVTTIYPGVMDTADGRGQIARKGLTYLEKFCQGTFPIASRTPLICRLKALAH